MAHGSRKVYVVGAGPGDPALITLKGFELLKKADLVVYAGSLVNEKLLDFCKKEAVKVNSHGKKLKEMVDIMEDFVFKGLTVVRLSSGDPSIYSSLREFKEELAGRGIGVEVIPGVSSFSAAAARIGEEFTIPEGPQSVVLTRISGKTPVPLSESLERFAATKAAIVLFLSVDRLSEIKKRLIRAGLSPDTFVYIVYRVTWEDERIVETDIFHMDQIKDIKKSALVIVLPGKSYVGRRSFLYSGNVEKSVPIFDDEISVIPVSAPAQDIALSILKAFPKTVLFERGRVRERFAEAWKLSKPVVFVGSVGIAVRVVSDFIKNKYTDVPVITVDIAGSFVVPIIGGHRGANRLSLRIARILGAVPVITTGTESLGVPSIEEIMEERELIFIGGSTLSFNSRAVRGEWIYSAGLGFHDDVDMEVLRSVIDKIHEVVGDEISVFAVPSRREKVAREKLLPLIPEGSCLIAVDESVLSSFPSVSNSAAEKYIGLKGVCEPASLAVLPSGELFIKKRVFSGIAFAVSRWRSKWPERSS